MYDYTFESTKKKPAASTMFVSIMKQVEERKQKAIEENDQKTLQNLEKYYGNASAENYFIEEPVLNKEGEYRFCYLDRKTGFAKIDEVLTAKDLTVDELLKGMGHEIINITTNKQLDDIFNELYSQEDYTKMTFKFCRFPNTDGDTLFCINNQNFLGQDPTSQYFLDMGFEKIIGSFYNSSDFNDDYSTGELLLYSVNIKEPFTAKFITSQYAQYKFLDVPKLSVRVVQDQAYETLYVYEQKVYPLKHTFNYIYQLTVNGLPLTDISNAKFTKSTDGSPIEIEDLGEGKFKIKEFLPYPINLFSLFNSVNLMVKLTLDDQTVIATSFGVSANFVADPSRTSFTITNVSRTNEKVTFNFKVTDNYTNGIVSSGYNAVRVFIPGYTDSYKVDIVNGLGSVTLENIPEQEKYILGVMIGYSGARTIIAPEFTIST